MKKALLLLGGIWHDFEGFQKSIVDLLEPGGWEIEATYQMERLHRLEHDQVDLLISYTCLGKHREGYDDSGPEGLSQEQIAAWTNWVQQGGGVLAVHSATVLGTSDASLAKLLGGAFIEHPPQFTFTVYPLSRSHAITHGIEAFSIRDEFYIQQVEPDVMVHMVAVDRGVAHPMVWSKSQGKGKVAYLAPGHGGEVWYHPAYQKLVEQTVDWLMT
jgi:type 1 glutamine amidotransferase